ncbi:MAG TPA: aldehyde:ferredoxin oxidoreductase [Thermoplasmatales archaeon]|nr:aldehyde:ferredoxin oxidoreductase [Thermoplasmatales archaeon]
MTCWSGRLLYVDLSKGEIKKEEIKEDLYKRYLGGDGFGSYYMNKFVSGDTDPLSGDNALILAPGLLVGTPIPTAGKSEFFAKSPLTDGWDEGACGGSIGLALKQAGYDVLIIKGKNEKPCYLFIDDDNVEIRDAQHLWGKTTRETEEEIKKEEKNCSVACIGIGGENLVRYAIISSDDRQAGRGGLGAVMGSKKLKAIAVRGSKDVNLKDPSKVLEQTFEWYEKMVNSQAFKEDGLYGSGEFLEWMNKERGTFPTRNWREGVFDQRQKIDPYYWAPRYSIKNKACIQCVKPCGKMFVIKEGKYKGAKLDGIEYETLFALGGNCGNPDIESVAKANELCDLYGIDTISAGGCIGFAMDLYENGILTKDDTDDIDLRFGNPEAVVVMIEKIAKREGLGNILAEGVKRAAEKIGKGAEKYAVHVRGMEPPAYDVRGIKGMGLAFLTSPRGACHLRSGAYALELLGKFWKYEGVDRLSSKNKGREIADMENFMAIYDALGVCKFSRGFFLLEGFREILKATAGLDYDEGKLLEIGERICNLKHLFNLKCGWKKEHIKLPPKIRIPIPEGASKGSYISEEEEKEMLDDYFKARGWTKEGEIPREKLEALGIEEFAK